MKVIIKLTKGLIIKKVTKVDSVLTFSNQYQEIFKGRLSLQHHLLPVRGCNLYWLKFLCGKSKSQYIKKIKVLYFWTFTLLFRSEFLLAMIVSRIIIILLCVHNENKQDEVTRKATFTILIIESCSEKNFLKFVHQSWLANRIKKKKYFFKRMLLLLSIRGLSSLKTCKQALEPHATPVYAQQFLSKSIM